VSRLPSWDLCLTNYPLSSCNFATAHPRMGEPAEDKILLMFAVMQQSSDLIGLIVLKF
jgi:hypothetical protein